VEWYGAFLGTRDDLARLMAWIIPKWDKSWMSVDAPPDRLAFEGRNNNAHLVLLETEPPPTDDMLERAERARAQAAQRWPARTVYIAFAVPSILPQEAQAELTYRQIGVYDRNWITRNIGEWGQRAMIRPLWDDVDDGQPGPYGPAYDAEMRGQSPAPGPAENTAEVHYGQLYLLDGEGETPGFDIRPRTVGIIGTEPGAAILLTGLHTGTVGFTVTVHDGDPGPDLDGYEDVVEISFDSRDGTASLVGWADENSRELPPLPAGPGTYRLRYHARGMDAGAIAQNSDVPVDEYLLQLWPAPVSPAATLKSTSQQHAYWQEH
jgi:hypothetical protein